LVLLPEATEKEPLLDFNYQHMLASTFYDLLKGTDYEGLHDEKSYKYFGFSRLYVDSLRTTKEGIHLQGAATLWYTTPDQKLLQTVVSSLENRNSITVGGMDFRIVSVSEPYSYRTVREEDTFITMSPVLLRKTIDKDGQLKQWELSPDDNDFSKVLVEKLKRKYHEYSGADGCDLEVISIWDVSKKSIRVVDIWHRCYYMKVRMKGSPDLLTFVYDCGLGEKNSMGFGMVRSPFDGLPVQTLEHLMEGRT
jgi:CRISPR-associated endoribonuclease Cas6